MKRLGHFFTLKIKADSFHEPSIVLICNLEPTFLPLCQRAGVPRKQARAQLFKANRHTSPLSKHTGFNGCRRHSYLCYTRACFLNVNRNKLGWSGARLGSIYFIKGEFSTPVLALPGQLQIIFLNLFNNFITPIHVRYPHSLRSSYIISHDILCQK